ncbi:MAG: hypothetical protein R3C26_21230 [Calditrichia bacterium]
MSITLNSDGAHTVHPHSFEQPDDQTGKHRTNFGVAANLDHFQI